MKIKVTKIFLGILVLTGVLTISGRGPLCYAAPRIFLTEPAEGTIVDYFAQDRITVAGEIVNLRRDEIKAVGMACYEEEYYRETNLGGIPAEELTLTMERSTPPLFSFSISLRMSALNPCLRSCIRGLKASVYYEGGSISSQWVYFCLDRLGPCFLTIDSPRGNQVFSSRDNININGTVRHECSSLEGSRLPVFSDILNHFDIKVDGVEKATGLRHFSYIGGDKWNWNHSIRVHGEGEHEITVIFYDKVGKHTENSVRIRIDNTPPVISRLSPRYGERIKSEVIPATITVSAEVRDGGGVTSGVDKVEFWANGRKVSERTGPIEDARYAAPVSGLREGWNEIMVKAYDKVQNHSSVSFRVYIERTMRGPRLEQKPPTGPQIQPPPKPIHGGKRPH